MINRKVRRISLDMFALEKALPKTSFSMARLVVPRQMGDGAISMVRLAVLVDVTVE